MIEIVGTLASVAMGLARAGDAPPATSAPKVNQLPDRSQTYAPPGAQKAREAWSGVSYAACFIEFAPLKPGQTPRTAEQLAAADRAQATR